MKVFSLYSKEYLGVEEGKRASRYETGEDDSEPVLVISRQNNCLLSHIHQHLPDIVWILPHFRQIVTDVIFFLIDQLQLQELGDVDDGGEDNDGEEVVDDPGAEPPSHRVVSVVEGVADSRVPAGQLLIREHYKSESLCTNNSSSSINCKHFYGDQFNCVVWALTTNG